MSSQIPSLIEELKRALKAAGKTYAELAAHLEVSEASVKRAFADERFTLERLEQACQFAGLELSDLIVRADERPPPITQFTDEQEEELFGDLKLLLVAHLVLARWSFADIVAYWQIDEHQAIRLLARLDRMRMIELQPGNRYRLLVSRHFRWRPNGPVQRFFKRHVQSAFFDSDFAHPGEHLVFISGMLARSSLSRLHEEMNRLAQSFDAATQEDVHLPLSERHTTSLVLAVRPWAFPPFESLRRQPRRKASLS